MPPELFGVDSSEEGVAGYGRFAFEEQTFAIGLC